MYIVSILYYFLNDFTNFSSFNLSQIFLQDKVKLDYQKAYYLR